MKLWFIKKNNAMGWFSHDEIESDIQYFSLTTT